MLSFFALVLAFYIWHALGVTIGLHRLLAHRAFKCPKFVEYFFVTPAYLCLQGSPIWWATMHRAHHRYSDTELDPHSPRETSPLEAFFFFRTGLCENYAYPAHINPETQSPDLMKDPVYRFLEQYESGNWVAHYWINIAICVLFRVVLFFCFGWKVALASVVAGILTFAATLLFNVVSHIPQLGYRSFETTEDSINCWWIAMLSMGEGWHNNHHAYPGSAKSGIKKFEFDLSWEILRLLRFVGLASQLNVQGGRTNLGAADEKFETPKFEPLAELSPTI